MTNHLANQANGDSYTQEFTATLTMKLIEAIPPSLISVNVSMVNPQLLISVPNSIIRALRIGLPSKSWET